MIWDICFPYLFVIMEVVIIYMAFKMGQLDERGEAMMKEAVSYVAYLRVSKSEEEIMNQRLALQEYVRKNHARIIKEFSDEDVSGWKVPVMERQGFKDLLEYCKKNGVNRILFYDITRFGRSWKDVIWTYYALEEEGFRLYFALQPTLSRDFYEKVYASLDEPLRTFMIDSALHQDLFNFARMAEFEVVINSMRIRAGMARAKAEGKKIGGYQLPDWVVDEIRKLLQEGYTYDEIQELVTYTTTKKKKVKHPSRALIARIAKEMGE